MELLVAIGFAMILIGSAVSAISLTSTIDRRNKPLQSATFLAQDLLDKTAVIAEANWITNIDALTPDAQYNIVPGCGGSCLAVVAGSEAVFAENMMFTRYFSVARVDRDSADNIVETGGADDPSTRKITATVTWQDGSTNPAVVLVKYVTRNRNISTLQTDWSGGAGQGGPAIAPDQYDTASAGVDVSTQNGSIKLQIP